MLIQTNAIVLNRILFRDTSIIVRLFTENEGKVSILSKGAWRPKNTTGPLLEPMNHINIQFFHKNNREIQILKEAVFVQKFALLRNNLGRIALALAVVEIIDKSTLQNNPSPLLYRLGWRVLDKLNDINQNIWFVFAFFLYQFSLIMGFLPNINNCSQCKKSIYQAGINNFTGELLCSNCFDECNIKISKKGYNFIRQLSGIHLENLNNISFHDNIIKDSIMFLESFILFHVEGFDKIQAMIVMRKLLNKSIHL